LIAGRLLGLALVALALPASAYAAPGDLYGTSNAGAGENSVLRAVPGGSFQEVVDIDDAGSFPTGLSMSRTGELLLADQGANGDGTIFGILTNGTSREISTNDISSAAGGEELFLDVLEVVQIPDGSYIAINNTGNDVIRVDAAGRQSIFPVGPEAINGGTDGLAVGPNGDLFIATNGGTVARVRGGVTTTVAEDLPDPQGLSVIDDNRLVAVTDYDTPVASLIDVRTGSVTPIASGAPQEDLYDVERLLDGRVVTGDYSERSIFAAPFGGGAPTPFSTAWPDNSPLGLAVEGPRCGGKVVTHYGSPSADVITGTPFRDVFAGLAGKDRIRTLGGKDIVCGGAAKDVIFGGAGKDALFGQAGKDRLVGGKGKDRVIGGKGKDACPGRGDKRKSC
jgi:Ca2+-binding RTX toxin-like protein